MINSFVLIGLMSYVCYTDFREKIIDDAVHIGMITHALLVILFIESHSFPDLSQASFGFVMGGSLMFLLYLTGGMGFGDVKLAAVMGLWLGVQVIDMIMLAFVVGLFFVVILSVKNRHLTRIIPFGPSLAMAAIFIHLSGWSMITHYF